MPYTVLLEVDELGKQYDGRRAVDAVSFAVEGGEVLALLGPNGAGKTTTLSMIAGILRPSSGTARIAGHDISAQSLAARRRVGIVPQELGIYRDISARENLRFFSRLYGLSGQQAREAIDWALRVAGLEDCARQRVSTFSGGMQRRLNVAIGIVHRPRLLILDEPTVGVDPQSRRFIFETVRRLAAEEGTAILYSSHYMAEVEALCSRVLIIDEGRLVISGDVQDLLERYARDELLVSYVGAAAAVAERLVERDGVIVEPRVIRASGGESVAEIASAIEAAGGRVTSVSRGDANLESVFLELTGHSLRDQS